MSKDLIILQKTEDMAVYAYQCIEQFPRGYKFTLGERIPIALGRAQRRDRAPHRGLDPVLRGASP